MKLTFSSIVKEDKLLIHEWETKHRNTPGFKAIHHYVLEDNIYYNLPELIDINYDRFPIGTDEFRNILIAKASKDTVAGFVLYNVFNLNHKPEVNLIYAAINPVMQHQGVATEMLTELFTNYEKYFHCKPTCVFTKIDQTNTPSQNMIKKFGLKLVRRPKGREYLCGFETDFENILNHISQTSQEK